MITSFIIYIQPQLQPDSSSQSASILSVLLYNMNKTAFGNDTAPTVEMWNGPPPNLATAQMLLYFCLAATLVCGVYAMLIKLLTDSNARCWNWNNFVINFLTRWVFATIYVLRLGVFLLLFIALTLQAPFLSSTSTLRFLKKIEG